MTHFAPTRLFQGATFRRSFTALLLSLAGLALGGCASIWQVDSQVQSFAHWTTTGASPVVPAAPQRYRFERLPSQQQGQNAANQDALEKLAAAAMARVGWTQAAAGDSAPWTLQVQTISSGPSYGIDPWWDNRAFFWGGWGVDRWRGHGQLALGWGGYPWGPMVYPPPDPWFQREFSLVIRSGPQAGVAYETRALHESRWAASEAIWRAMIEAALQGFPTPPTGPRRVVIEVPPR
jgi:hypothetical protein